MEAIQWEGDNQFDVEAFVGQDAIEFDDELTFVIQGKTVIVELGDTLIKYPDGRVMIQRGSGREGDRHKN